MSESDTLINNAIVAAHPQLQAASIEALEIANFLQTNGINADHGKLFDPALRQSVIDGEFDLLIALGGDGTMLRAGHLCGPSGVPVLGINMGGFGFLTEVKMGQWRDLLSRLSEGDFWLEDRMMLRAEQWRDNQCIETWDVVNEVVIGRGHIVRPVHLHTHVDDRFLTTYVADGIIVATPTGSTAYAMAAGGPILPPDLRNILLVAVAPHLSVDRAIVLAEGSIVSVAVHTEHEAVISPDGQPPIDLQDGDSIRALSSEHSVQFLRFQDPGYFYRNLTLHMSQNPSAGTVR